MADCPTRSARAVRHVWPAPVEPADIGKRVDVQAKVYALSGHHVGHSGDHRAPHARGLLIPRETVQYAYFPVDGVVSLLMIMEDATPVQVATVGSEGFVSIESILSTDQNPYEVICQTEVEALRAEVADLRMAFRASERVRDVLLRYAAVAFSCTGRSVACKVRHPVEQRAWRAGC